MRRAALAGTLLLVLSGCTVAGNSAEAGVEQVVWYVDGKPFLVAAGDSAVRWPLQPGIHTFEAKVPYRGLSSAPVTIEVQ